MKKLIVDELSIRLDNFISLKEDISRSQAQKIIALGVLVNGNKVTKNGYALKVNDEVVYEEEKKEVSQPERKEIEVAVVTEETKKENIDECHYNDGKDDCIKPVKQNICLFAFLVLLLPEQPFHLFGDMVVKNRDKAEKPPIVSEPDNPYNIEDSPKCKPNPFIVV